MTLLAEVSHVGFSDESQWNVGRYRSLGLVTMPVQVVARTNSAIRQLLNESGVAEFKWNALKGGRGRIAAQKLCDFSVDQACRGNLRVDVLIWDTHDRRHAVPGRDDVENLKRMYYHLFRNVLGLRWPDNSVWQLSPDEHTAIDWDVVHNCLYFRSTSQKIERSLFTDGREKINLRREFGVRQIRPVSSREFELVQLGDLFAGLAVFSRENFDEYKTWLPTASGQPPLFVVDEQTPPSRRSEERFRVLHQFSDECKKRALGVSLLSSEGLRTHQPSKPINFWLYTPQHPLDVAPKRQSQ